MSAAGIALKFVNDRPIGHTETNCHLVFGVKKHFTRKACYVASGHLADPPDNVTTYASVFSRESVCILFLIDDLYDTNFLAADIKNAFINVQCAKNVFLRQGLNLRVARACELS